MIIGFFGTPIFAIPALEALLTRHELKVVITQPDKPKGRRLDVKPSPVKTWALEHNIPVLEPEVIKGSEFISDLSSLNLDALVVAAYGKFLPPPILSLPDHGCINIHGSLLPLYRGAAPIQRAIMDGAKTTGVTIMRMDEGMDTGDMFAQGSIEIKPTDDAAAVSDKLSRLGADLLMTVLDDIARGDSRAQKQDDAAATYAPPIEKAELEIDWAKPASTIVDLVRALSPAPGARTSRRGKLLKIGSARATAADGGGPGLILEDDGRLLVGAKEGSVELIEVQPEGKRSMSAAEFIRGYRPQTGETLGVR